MKPRSPNLPIASVFGPRHLLRLFLHHTGAPPSEIAATRRVQAAKRLIDQTTMGLSDIAFAAGFHSVRRFNDAFRATYGRPPSSFRRAVQRCRPASRTDRILRENVQLIGGR
jgi:AraC family transcriptional regulator of adaptative response/methylated-DNA-[protein]-cysteine methyltransferase